MGKDEPRRWRPPAFKPSHHSSSPYNPPKLLSGPTKHRAAIVMILAGAAIVAVVLAIAAANL